MGDRLERLVILPFSIGCISQTSVDVSNTRCGSHGKRIIPRRGNIFRRRRHLSSFLSLTLIHPFCYEIKQGEKPTISSLFILKLLKIFPQLFKEDDRDDRNHSDDEREMEIGFPTDVKHVSHIGPGSAAMLKFEDTILFRQFDLAMTAQAAAPLLTGGAVA